MRRPSLRDAGGLALVFALALGCASAPVQRERGTPGGIGDSSNQVGELGLEVRLWVVNDGLEALEEFIGEGARSFPEDPELKTQWIDAGLELVELPLERVEELPRELSVQQVRGRHWLGQTAVWREIARGQSVPRGVAIEIEGGALKLGPGALRVLARSWGAPRVESPVLQTAIAFQHVEAEGAKDAATVYRRPVLRTIEEEGLIFRHLTMRVGLERGRAYLLLPWTREEEGAARRGAAVGPPLTRLPTLGEALLGRREDGNPLRPEPVLVVVLTPRVPEGLRLLMERS